jgi:hypothetical protein
MPCGGEWLRTRVSTGRKLSATGNAARTLTETIFQISAAARKVTTMANESEGKSGVLKASAHRGSHPVEASTETAEATP